MLIVAVSSLDLIITDSMFYIHSNIPITHGVYQSVDRTKQQIPDQIAWSLSKDL